VSDFLIWQIERIVAEAIRRSRWPTPEVNAAGKEVSEVIRRHEAALQALFARE
jgi:hypothetical protein